LELLFLVRGVTNTSYLRNLVGETYQDGSWLPAQNAPMLEYAGGQIAHSVTDYASAYETSFEIQPFTVFGGFIPTTKDPSWISLNSSLQYYGDQQVFFSEYEFQCSYNLSYTSYRFDLKKLEDAQTVPDSKYLEVPSELLQKLQPLALNITQNLTSPFDQAKAIEDYLRQNYSYDLNYTLAPANVDPVEWFLFNSKRGVCTHFNSAFVLLARSIGIPSRLCGGFLINAASDYQTVKPNQRHAYAEVLFKNLGWITFDATAPAQGGIGQEMRPYVKIAYPTQRSYVSGQRITIAGQASGFYKDAKLSISNGGFSLTYWGSDFVYDNSSLIEDGTYTVAVSAADASGNTASDAVMFTVDNTQPKVKIDYPANGTSLSDSSILVNGSIEELNKGDLEPFINDSHAPFTLVFWDSSSGTFSFANVSDITGDVSLKVSFRDMAGNVGSASVTFKVEPKAPTRIPTLTNITRCGNIGIKGSNFTVEGQVLDLNGTGVGNLNVLVYLTKSKNETGRLCGEGNTAEGYFNITCYVPKEVEVGSYQVVAHAVGNGQYEDSWSDPDIKIMAETNLSINLPSKVIQGRAFMGNGTLKERLTGQPVANQTVFYTVDEELGRFEENLSTVTDNRGFFTWSFTLWLPGNYTVLTVFNGSEGYINSSFSGITRVPEVTISPTTPETLIRSENATLTGRVHAEDLNLTSEDLLISLNGSQIATANTDSQGLFNAFYQVPYFQTLGDATLTYQLRQPPNTAYVQNISILARTSLTCNASQISKREDTFNFTVTLKDDHQQPMGNIPVRLVCTFNNHNSTSYESVTDSNGKAEYTGIVLPPDTAESMTYNASYPGSTFYMPSSYSNTARVPSIPFPYTMLLLIIGTSLPASITVLSAFIWKRRKTSKNNVDKGLPSNAPTVPSSKKKADLQVRFPQISNPFPLVWGVKEPLIIELQLNEYDKSISSADLYLVINDETETSLKTSGRKVQTNHVFDVKGAHKLKAKFSGDDEWEDTVVENEIRIVDYREEIVDLFNSFFKSAKTKFQSVHDEMTPRELQGALINQIQAPKHDALDTAVSIFEVADYSLHEVNRRDYEQIYLALKELEG
jgi:transglutaminase-like putative cysteine protease